MPNHKPNKTILLIIICILCLSLPFLAGLWQHNLALKNYAKQRISPKHIERHDPYLGWALNENRVETINTSDFTVTYSNNSLGLRDKEITLDKPQGQYRILLLGESTVFGSGIAYGKRFSEVIEQRLRGVEIVNMGVSGYGIDQCLMLLKRDGGKYGPDMIMLACIDGLLKRSRQFRMAGRAKPRFVLAADKESLLFEDTEKSCDKLRMLKAHGLKTSETSDKERWQEIFEQLTLEEKESSMDDNDFSKLLFLILKEYRDYCLQRNKPLVLVYMNAQRENFDKYLKDACRELSIEALVLSDALKQAQETGHELYFKIDPHYNPYAHKRIGTLISDYLAARHGLKKR